LQKYTKFPALFAVMNLYIVLSSSLLQVVFHR